MDETAFKAAYNESRNGADQFFRNPLYRNFLYSDGVRDCAEAGCYWLLDILGTELPLEFKKRPEALMCVVYVKVDNGKAKVVGEWRDDDPNPWCKSIDYTDMPTGVWNFLVIDNGDGTFTCILPTEY